MASCIVFPSNHHVHHNAWSFVDRITKTYYCYPYFLINVVIMNHSIYEARYMRVSGSPQGHFQIYKYPTSNTHFHCPRMFVWCSLHAAHGVHSMQTSQVVVYKHARFLIYSREVTNCTCTCYSLTCLICTVGSYYTFSYISLSSYFITWIYSNPYECIVVII